MSEPLIMEILQDAVKKYAGRDALCLKDHDQWTKVTYEQLSERAKQFASYLIELGIGPQERVAILSESRPEWGISLFGCVRAAVTLVPLDIKLTQAELVSILSDCQPKVLIVSEKFKEAAELLKTKISSIKHIFLANDGKGDDKIPSLDSLKPKQAPAAREAKADDTALLVYTSGTTGNPKGVMISYGNIMFEVASFRKILGLTGEDRFLSILPLNHLLELTGGFLGILGLGGTICFCHSIFPQEIIKSMSEQKITGMISVPLVLRTLKAGIEREIRRKGEDISTAFQKAFEKAESMSTQERRELFADVLNIMGGHMRVIVSGGAPLDLDVAAFFDRLGICIIQGYGLTETSPVISVNGLTENRLGSVGKALSGVEIKIDKKNPQDGEGEILTRGPHVMKGYYKHPEQTSEVIDKDGWFHTGDIGKLDEEGFLYITGRIKNLIVLGGGKKVFPEEVEAVLQQGETIKEVCVMSYKNSKDGTEDVCAVIVPSDALIKDWDDSPDSVRDRIKKEVNELCENLAAYKKPAKLFIHPEELEKTPTRKVKRAVLQEWLKSQARN